MGWLTSLGSFITGGGGKTVDNVFDKDDGLLAKVGGWIGNANFSKEEKVEADSKLIGSVIGHAKSSMSENTERSKTRRTLSINIMQVEMFLVLASVFVWPFNPEYSKFIWMVASSTLMAGAFWAVVVFFFGAYGIGAHLKKKA